MQIQSGRSTPGRYARKVWQLAVKRSREWCFEAAVYAFLSGRTDILDIALVYALINFIGVVAVLKLVEQGNFYTSGEEVANEVKTEE